MASSWAARYLCKTHPLFHTQLSSSNFPALPFCKAELDETLEKYGLLDEEIYTGMLSDPYESGDYGKTMVVNICRSATALNLWNSWFAPTLNLVALEKEGQFSAFDICEDLGIDKNICSEQQLLPIDSLFARLPECDNDEFIQAVIAAALDPQSFLNRPGFERWGNFLKEEILPIALLNPDCTATCQSTLVDSIGLIKATLAGGMLVPRVDPDVLLDLAELSGGVTVNHWAHGEYYLLLIECIIYFSFHSKNLCRMLLQVLQHWCRLVKQAIPIAQNTCW